MGNQRRNGSGNRRHYGGDVRNKAGDLKKLVHQTLSKEYQLTSYYSVSTHRTVLPMPVLVTFRRRFRYPRLPRTRGATVGRADSPCPPALMIAVTIAAVPNGWPLASRRASRIILPSSPCRNSLMRFGRRLLGM